MPRIMKATVPSTMAAARAGKGWSMPISPGRVMNSAATASGPVIACSSPASLSPRLMRSSFCG